MNTAFVWFNDLVQWLGRWIPRLVLIDTTHRGVRFGPRGGVREVGPGLVLYWPMTHRVVEVPVTLQSVQLAGQILPLCEEPAAIIPRVSLCALNVHFSITDAARAATRVLHFQALVNNRAQAALAHYWEPTGDWKDALRAVEQAERDVRSELLEYGIDLRSLSIAGIGKGVALKNVADWSYSDLPSGRRPE